MQGISACALIALLLWSGNDYRPTVAESTVASYRFNLLAWEAGNVFDKWYHELAALLPWNSLQPREQRIALAEEFFQLGEEERRLESELLTISESSPRTREIRARLDEVHGREGSIRSPPSSKPWSGRSAISCTRRDSPPHRGHPAAGRHSARPLPCPCWSRLPATGFSVSTTCF